MQLTIRVRPGLVALADTAGEVYGSWQGNRNPFIDHPERVASNWP